jgi:hypothetical protein
MHPDELAELLEEVGATRLAERLDAEGLPRALGPTSWPAAGRRPGGAARASRRRN